jgi:hypothetical protein
MCCFVSRDIRLNVLPDPLLSTAHLDHMHSSISIWRKKYSIETARKHLRRVSLVEQELLTLPEHPSSNPVFSWVRVIRSFVLCVMFCWSLFVLLSFFFWSLCCLSFFDLHILITPLESSNSSYHFCNCYI